MSISIIKLNFEVVKKLNIGSKKATIKADMPFEKINVNGREKVYIPGSTLKGVLRTCMIRVAPLLGYGVLETINPENLQREGSKDIVSQTLGKPNENGKVLVSDAYLESDTEVLTHVRIEDDTLVVKEGSLFKVEYLPIGSKFSCEIKCYNLSIEEMRLLLASISQMKYERIGKCGLVNVKIDSSSLIPNEYLQDELIKEIYEVMKSG